MKLLNDICDMAKLIDKVNNVLFNCYDNLMNFEIKRQLLYQD